MISSRSKDGLKKEAEPADPGFMAAASTARGKWLPRSRLARQPFSAKILQTVRWSIVPVIFVACVTVRAGTGLAAAPTATTSCAPPSDVVAEDYPADGGHQILVSFRPSPDDTTLTAGKAADGKSLGRPSKVVAYAISRSGEFHGVYRDVAFLVPTKHDYHKGRLRVTVDQCQRGVPYFFRVRAVSSGGGQSAYAETIEPAVATRQWFEASRQWMAIITFVLCSAVIVFILLARSGRPLKVRKIAGLEAVDEAVGRATEMGRSVMFIPGIQDMNDIQTIAGLTVLAHVSRTAAEYDARVEVPTCRSLVMTAARETVHAAFVAAGRSEAYHDDAIYYVTDEQFGYVAYLSGMMVREKPAACFYMGSFFAESLILAETGNSIGAIQVAGTAQPAQLPFFVAACDYTLIGEELFAASAYLSGEPDQLGSLKGQDVGKLIVAVLLIVGCGIATAAVISGSEGLDAAATFLKSTVLS